MFTIFISGAASIDTGLSNWIETMESFRLTSALPEPDGSETPLTVRGLTKEEAFASFANLLHLTMFECDTRNNIFKDYVDYDDEEGFLQDCRDYVCADPNAQTSDKIWSDLKAAVDNVKIETLST